MKFLVVIHYFPPHIGGMESVVKRQAESLAQRGGDVTVMTCRHDRKLPVAERTDGGYSVKRLRALNFIETKLGMAFPIVSPGLFFRMLKQFSNYDVIHIHDVFYMSSWLVGLAAILRKKPFYLTQHVAVVDHPRKEVEAVQNLIHKTIGRAIYKHAEAIVVYNVNVKNYLISIGVDDAKIVLNHNGIDTAFFAPTTGKTKLRLRKQYGLPLDKPIVLFVGRLIPEKGFDLLFDSRSENYTTLFVGGGTVPKRMQYDKNAIFFGPASQVELADLYRLSDLFVFPAAVEMFALVMQEAMACGLPVITADNSNYHHYDLDLQLMRLVSRDTKAIKKEIASVLADKDLQNRMSLYSRKLAAERFSWQSNYAHEYAIYDQSKRLTPREVVEEAA